MGRSGLYEDDGDDPLSFGRWRAQVKNAIRGKRGQTLLRDMLAALDAMPEKRLIAGDLVFEGSPEFPIPEPHEDIVLGGDVLVDGMGDLVRVGDVCALGALGCARNLNMTDLDPHDPDRVADAFDVAHQLAREIMWINDDRRYFETPEERFARVRGWVSSKILPSGPKT